MTRPLRDFLPLVLPHAPQCPNPVAIQYLRLAAIEWCERTRCWREIHTTTVDQQNKTIVAPDYATIHEIELAEFTSASVDKVELTPTQYSSLSISDLANTDGEAGPPRYITQSADNVVSVYPYQTGSLELSLFLKPISGTDPSIANQNIVPAHVFTQSAEKVAWGALARLLNLSNASWYDPNNAAVYQAKFDMACDDKFNTPLRGQHRAPVRAKGSFF